MNASAWSTQHLAEFLAGLSACDTRDKAISSAVERIAESFDAEVCAYRQGGEITAAVGFPLHRIPTGALLAAEEHGTCDVPGVGACAALAVPVSAEEGSSVILARADAAFLPEERMMLRSMGRVLGLTLQMFGALDRERAARARLAEQDAENQHLLNDFRQRQALLERLSAVQHAILVQSPIDDVLRLINDSAATLLGEDLVGLRLVDDDDPETMTLVAHRGLEPEVATSLQRSSIHSGTGGAAITSGQLVVFHDYASERSALPQVVDSGIVATMAAPVRENGKVVGSLVVASSRIGRRFDAHDQEILSAFADHVSLALTDARTRQSMHQALDAAMHQALHDPLTGLPNRSLFVDRLSQALARTTRRGTRVGVLFIDLDNFKIINDSCGHATGDELLTAVGARIAECFRDVDTVARFGGDEFAVVVEDVADPEQAHAAAARLLDALTAPFPLSEDRLSIGASVGVVLGGEGDRPEQLLLNADVAMYHAKAGGKGRWSLFRPEMHAAVLDRIELEGALRTAIEGDQLDLAYQPIVDLGTGGVVGVEALLRWRHPTRGAIPPADFIPVAEETGLILEIGRWVLERACRDAREWHAPGRPDVPLSVSVNMSARQMQDATLIPFLREVLARCSFPASRLTLEITESVLIDDARMAAEWLGELKDLGVRLALDDFGTGYSSLSYLRRFPIDVVKIDKSFVDGLGCAAGDERLVEAIVNLTRSLGLTTTGEGVETADQHLRLLEMGCGLGQGYHFGYPISAAALQQRLELEGAAAAATLTQPAHRA